MILNCIEFPLISAEKKEKTGKMEKGFPFGVLP